MLSDQNTGNKEWQRLKAIDLSRMSTCLPALKAGKPLSRIVIVEAAFPTRLAVASRLGNTSADDRKQASREDADFGKGHGWRGWRVSVVEECSRRELVVGQE